MKKLKNMRKALLVVLAIVAASLYGQCQSLSGRVAEAQAARNARKIQKAIINPSQVINDGTLDYNYDDAVYNGGDNMNCPIPQGTGYQGTRSGGYGSPNYYGRLYGYPYRLGSLSGRPHEARMERNRRAMERAFVYHMLYGQPYNRTIYRNIP